MTWTTTLDFPLVVRQSARLLVAVMAILAEASPTEAGNFSTSSPWNQPIPANAAYASTPAAGGLVAGLDTWDPATTWAVPYYTATSADPLRAVLYNANAWYKVYTGEWKRSGNPRSVETAILASSSTTFPYPGNVFSSTSTTSWVLPPSYNKTINPPSPPAKFLLGSKAVPAPGTDGHMAVAQPNGSVVETYATIVLSGGQVVALSYGISSLSSLGDGWQNGQTASMLPAYAGQISDEEIAAGIKHAISVSVPAKLLAPKIAYPAYAFDRDAMTSKDAYSGTIPMGGRLALPPGVTVSSLGLATAQGKAIAAAAKTYGLIIVDRGGGGVTFRVRPNAPIKDPALHTYGWPLQSDLNKILAKVVRVSY